MILLTQFFNNYQNEKSEVIFFLVAWRCPRLTTEDLVVGDSAVKEAGSEPSDNGGKAS